MNQVPPALDAIRKAIAQHVHGKDDAIDAALVCLIAGGHLLIEDVPGVGKTTLAYALSRSIDCAFNRIQFTSDIIPSDILGVSIYQREQHRFEFFPGPIFANIVLADEINRASPKSQSALLEAMERSLVSADGQTHAIALPFMVVATQNPVDFESTFPLPNAQLDRFLMRIDVGYPDRRSEGEMLRHGALHYDRIRLEPVANKQDILELQAQASEVFVEDSVFEHIQDLVSATRAHARVEVGVSPRGALAFKSALQAAAFLAGRRYVSPDDVSRWAKPCLAHRLRLRARYGAEQDWKSAAELLDEIRRDLPAPHTRD